MKKVRIYLASTIYKELPDILWKTKFVGLLSDDVYEFFDPDPINECNNLMIARDKYEISNCNIFVAYIKRFTCGTSMEILHAFNQQTIPIIIVNPGLIYQNDLWLKYHSHVICENIQQCSEYVKDMKF